MCPTPPLDRTPNRRDGISVSEKASLSSGGPSAGPQRTRATEINTRFHTLKTSPDDPYSMEDKIETAKFSGIKKKKKRKKYPVSTREGSITYGFSLLRLKRLISSP